MSEGEVFTPRTFVVGFTEEVEESDTRSAELRHTNLMPPGSGTAKMPPREYKVAPTAEERASVVTITSPATPVELADLPASPRGVLKKCLRLGWTAQAHRTETHNSAVLFASTTDDHDAGSERYPAEDQVHWSIEARMVGEHKLGFQAYWTERKGKTAFTHARIFDPVGFQIENYATYKPIPVSKMKDEPGWATERRGKEAEVDANRRNYEYNDRTTRTVYTITTDKAKDLTDFLGDYLAFAEENGVK